MNPDNGHLIDDDVTLNVTTATLKEVSSDDLGAKQRRIAKVLTVDDCLEVLEETLRDYALGNAANRPRAHSYAPRRYEPVQWYMLKTMDAILPRYRVGGIRLTSDIVIEKLTDGKMRREKSGLARADAGLNWVSCLACCKVRCAPRIEEGCFDRYRRFSGFPFRSAHSIFAPEEVRVFSPT